MSLLIEALQRASKEKERRAAGGSPDTPIAMTKALTTETPQANTIDLAQDETWGRQAGQATQPPPTSFPELSFEALEEQAAEPAPTPSEQTSLPIGLEVEASSMTESQSEPEPEPEPAFELTQTPSPSVSVASAPPPTAPATVETPHETLELLTPQPAVAPVAASATLEMTALSTPPLANTPPLMTESSPAPVQVSTAESAANKPQIAREILTATAASTTTAAKAKAGLVPTQRRKKIAFFATGGLCAVLGASFLLGLWDPLFEPDLPPLQVQKQATLANASTPLPPSPLVTEPPAAPVPPKLAAEAASTTQAPTKTPASQPSPSTENAPPATFRHSARQGTTGQAVFVGRPAAAGILEQAYAALTDGRLEAAQIAYRMALQSNPDERDALLGLAYLAHRQGHTEEAKVLYQRVLRQEPAQPQALAGLLALQPVEDAPQAASRAREMVEQNPDSAAALTTLGHLMVREGRLADAQQAFFRATLLEPEQALHFYNLAVALDRLHKYDLAIRQYEQALSLNNRAAASEQTVFPREAARQRLAQLRTRNPKENTPAP